MKKKRKERRGWDAAWHSGERRKERRSYVSPSTMGKIFSLMNQDECTRVPITLQPRSPYFALLDFCHFKANETLERQGWWIEKQGRWKVAWRSAAQLRYGSARDRC